MNQFVSNFEYSASRRVPAAAAPTPKTSVKKAVSFPARSRLFQKSSQVLGKSTNRLDRFLETRHKRASVSQGKSRSIAGCRLVHGGLGATGRLLPGRIGKYTLVHIRCQGGQCRQRTNMPVARLSRLANLRKPHGSALFSSTWHKAEPIISCGCLTRPGVGRNSASSPLGLATHPEMPHKTGNRIKLCLRCLAT